MSGVEGRAARGAVRLCGRRRGEEIAQTGGKTPAPNLSVPSEEPPSLDEDTRAFLDAHGGHSFVGAAGYVPGSTDNIAEDVPLFE